MSLSISHIRTLLHTFAACLFFIFAAVKIAAIKYRLPILDQRNTIFPFLNNSILYYLSVSLDFIAAFSCLKYAGKKFADYCIFAFILLMLWYKLGLYLTGDSGYGCGCLGVLSLLFRITPAQENAYSLGALGLLALCTFPGLVPKLYSLSKQYCRFILLLLGILTMFPLNLQGETLEIKGLYSYNHYNPDTGVSYTNHIGEYIQCGTNYFSVLLSEESYKISVTNTAYTAMWTEIAYDGTNIYSFTPFSIPFIQDSNKISNAQQVTVSPSPFFMPSVSDWAEACVPWITFGFNPASAKPDKNGIIEIPLPWETPRRKPLAYGWNWIIAPSKDSRFVESCKIVRAIKADLERSSEFLRKEINYPENIKIKNLYLSGLEDRNEITNGFLRFEYNCIAWTETNDVRIPAQSQQVRYLPGYKAPYFRASLTVTSITMSPSETDFLKPSNEKRFVEDYRYKMANKTRIYKCAQYTLNPGEAWKGANDPTLLKEAYDHLLNGKRYDYYDYSYRQISVWVLAIMLLMIPLMLHWVKKHKQRKE